MKQKTLLIIGIIFFISSLFLLGYKLYASTQASSVWGEDIFVERSDGDYDLVNSAEIVGERIFQIYEGVIQSKVYGEQGGEVGITFEIQTELGGEKILSVFIPNDSQVENGEGFIVIKSSFSEPSEEHDNLNEIDNLLVEGSRVYIETINEMSPELELEGLNSFVLIQ